MCACALISDHLIIILAIVCVIDRLMMSALEEYERAPKRLKVSAEDDEELEEGEESDTASAGLVHDDEDEDEDEGQSRARRKVRLSITVCLSSSIFKSSYKNRLHLY